MSSIRRLTVTTSAVHHSGRTRLLCWLLSHSAGDFRQVYAKGTSRFPVSYIFLTPFPATKRLKRELLHALSPLL
jgi:hypothetical protein